MIVRELEYLPRFEPKQKLIVDVETTSFDDDKTGFNPFQGSRVCGYAISDEKGSNSWYIPIRHRDNQHNLPMENTLRWLKDTLGSGRDIVNHNIKFDAAFWEFDGVTVKGKLIDTMILARIWKNDLFRLGLDALTDGGKDKRVKEYLKAAKSKDYGRVPVQILGPYAEQDAKITAKLYQQLKRGIRSECHELVKIEVALTKLLHEQRMHGIRVNWDRLKEVWKSSALRAIQCQDTIDDIAGHEVDIGNQKEIDEMMIYELGIEPIAFTETGKPQWNAAVLDQIDHPVAQPLKEASHLYHLINTYCQGWWERKGDDDRLHPEFNQPGARTGRLSSKNPNFQNVIREAEEMILPDEGCNIGGGDYSQVEYRIFAHYAQDEKILASYEKNPMMDFHGQLADMIGVPRQMAKALNFSFVYGMGKRKLLAQISALLTIAKDDQNLMSRMQTFLRGGGRQSDTLVNIVKTEEFEEIASNIYDDYHKTVPSIRQLQKRVSKAVKYRGWIKNYMGRIYEMGDAGAHKALNYLIQGSAADIFKQKLMITLEELPHIRLITNVHDSVFFSIPREAYFEDMRRIVEIMEDVEMRTPIVFEPKISHGSWGDCVAVKPGETIEEKWKLSK